MSPTLPGWAKRLVRRTAGGADVCAAKAAYGTELHARVAGRNLLRSAVVMPGATRLWPYACVHCRGWHLSSHGRGDVTPISAGATHEGVPSTADPDRQGRPRGRRSRRGQVRFDVSPARTSSGQVGAGA